VVNINNKIMFLCPCLNLLFNQNEIICTLLNLSYFCAVMVNKHVIYVLTFNTVQGLTDG
jgi:hypothetical protein